MTSPLRVGILAGESSGDILGAGLMAELLKCHPDASFEGIGGPLMIAQGFNSHAPMERLSVMGLEPLKRLPELLGIRRRLTEHFIKNPPDVFIGIDAPDFNLALEMKLRQAKIPTIHYVSPSVWAWRQKRIKKIAKAVDLMLTLFPFEVDIYQQHDIPVSFVGHPLADEISPVDGTVEARAYFNIPPENKVLALLPGSRQSEVARLTPAFLDAARLCQEYWPELSILLPCASLQRRKQIKALMLDKYDDINITLIDGESRKVMAAADFVLIASGTATLEALLLKKPMLVCYRMAALAYAIFSRLLKVPYFSLPNLLAGRKLVEELVQKEVNPDNLFQKIKAFFEDSDKHQEVIAEYEKVHLSLRQNASERAAQEVLKLVP